MTLGPTIIRRCSACGKLIAQHTLNSVNTFGARFWTDGKMEAPMCPDLPRLVKCGHCEAVIWIDEQEKVGEVELDGPDDAKYEEACPCANPSIADYLAATASGAPGPQRERYLRFRVWWAGNDVRRQGGEDVAPLSADEIANLRAITALLDEADERERITKAEAMREMGKYQEAEALLSRAFGEELAQAAFIIRSLAAQGIPFVREMKLN